MNKHLYRIVFNHALGLFQVVSELIRRPGRGASQADGSLWVRVRPVSLALWALFGWIGVASVASASQAGTSFASQITSDPHAPGNQRPTVLGAPGQAALINIQTPSAAGVSRNTYNQFNVDSHGAVLNNSRTRTQTQLAGAVGGNPWLATGTAKVILNEITGSHPSQLNGTIEVAGDRAQVVIANPAGIACDGCGFLNANRVTLTTGTPVLTGGALDGYRVVGGTVQINGKGLDAMQADYTDIIARAVQVNGGIWATQLQVIAGANQVNVDQTSHGTGFASQITPIAGSGAPATFALDVSALGGMYANKITLLGTEYGVGARNAGSIGAQAGELTVTIDGRLENTGSLQSKANTQISASGGVANAGTISATNTLSIRTAQDLDNRDGALNAARIAVDAASLRNQGGTLTQTGSQGLSLQAGSLSNVRGSIGRPVTPVDGGNWGNLPSPGDGASGNPADGNASGGAGDAFDGSTAGTQPVATPLPDGSLRITGTLDNDGGTIRATSGVDLTSANGLSKDGGTLNLRQFTLTGGELSNRGGKLVIDGAAAIRANQLVNDEGQLNVADALSFNVQGVSNRGGTISHAGTASATLTVTGMFDNTGGTLASNATSLTLNLGSLVNDKGNIDHIGTGGLTLNTGAWHGAGGSVVTGGAARLTAGTVDHQGATLNATQLTLHAENVDNRGGVITASGTDANVLDIADTLDNGNGGSIQSNGDLTLTAATLDNTDGIVHASDTLTVAGNALINAGGKLDGQGTVDIIGATLDNTAGQVIQRGDGVLTLDVAQTLINADKGLIGAEGAAQLHAGWFDNRRGNTVARQDLAITIAGDLLNRDRGQVQAGGALSLSAGGTLDNSSGSIDAIGAANLQANAIANAGGQILAGASDTSSAGLSVTTYGALDNHSGTIGNRGGDLLLNAASLDNSQSGVVVAQRDLTLDAVGSVNNSQGTVTAARNLSYQNSSATLDNTGGQFGANGIAWLNLISVANIRGRLQADTLWLTTPLLNNTEGHVVADAQHTALRTLAGLGTLTGSQALDVHFLGDYTHLAGQGFKSDGVLSLKVDGTLTNQGTVQTRGELHVTAYNLINQGTLTASNDEGTASAHLSVNGQIGNQTGASIDADTLTLNATDVTNTSSRGITGNAIRIDADTLTNGRDLGIAEVGAAYGEAFIGAAQTLDLRIDRRLANLDGELYSGGDLSIAGRRDGTRVATLDNVSGRIQADGDAHLAADVISNRRRFVETAQVVLTQEEQAALSSDRAYDNALTPAEQVRMAQLFRTDNRTTTENVELLSYLYRTSWVHVDQVSDADLATLNATYNQIAIDKYGQRGGYLVVGPGGNPGAEYKQTDTYLTRTQITRAAAEAQILTGGNLNIDLGTHLTNVASTIAATRNLTIDGQASDGSADTRIDNIAITGQYGVQRDIDALIVTPVAAKYRSASDGSWKDAMVIFPSHIGTESITVSGPILAGATLSGQNVSLASHDINNTAVAVTGGITALDSHGLDGPGSTSLGSDNQVCACAPGDRPLPGLVPPSNGKYSQHGDPGAPFLVTTAPRFAQGPSTSSNYLLRALGTDPSNIHKRLGDGYYEQNLVLDQLLQLTGRRTINGGDGLSQYQALMDGAASEAAHLGLQLGAPLTSAQITSLSNDIVWLVDQVVDGQHVLVPVVYLSKATAERMKADGALIAGNTINVHASGALRNDGTIAGSQGLTIAADTLINRGSLSAGDTLSIATQSDTVNHGTLSGNTIGITAGGSVINAPTMDGLKAKGGRIVAGIGGVQIIATNDVINQGTITSQGSATVVAGRDYVQNAATSSIGTKAAAGSLSADGNAAVIAGRDAVFDQSTLSAGKVAYVEAGRDAFFNAATVSGGTGVGVVAGRDIVSTAVTDTTTAASFNKQGKNWTSTTTTDTTTRGSTFNSGGDVTMQAGRDIDLTAATIKADGAVGMVAGRDINLGAAENTHTETQDSYSKHGKTKTTTHSDIQDTAMVGTSISGNLGVALSAGNDINALAATVNSSDGAVLLHADRDINLLAGQDTHSETTDSKRTKKGFLSKKETTTHDEVLDTTAIGTAISGKQGVALDAGRDITAVGAKITSSDGAVLLHADRDINLFADQDTHSETTDSKSTKKGFLNKKETTTHDAVVDTTAVGTSISGKQGIALDAGHNVLGIGTTLQSSDGGIAVTAGDQVAFLAAANTHDTDHSEKVRRSGVEWIPNPKQGTQKKETITSQVTTVGSTLDAAGPIVVVSGSDQTYQAANISSGTGTALISGGAINFVTATNSDNYQRDSSKHNVAYQAQDHRLRLDTTEVQTSITGPVAMAAADGITIGVGQKQGETQEEAIARASQQREGTQWIADMQGQNNVSWQSIDEQHVDEHQHHEGVTKAAGVIITVATAYFAGVGASALMDTGATAGTTFAAGGAGNAVVVGSVSRAAGQGVGAAAQGYDWKQAALNGAVTGGLTAGLFYGTGELGLKYKWIDGSLEKSFAHGVAGGTSNLLTGGSFKNGFISSALAEWSSPLLNKLPGTWEQAAGHAGAGAVSSWATGGDPELGALNGLSGYMFNYLYHAQRDRRDAEVAGCQGDPNCVQSAETKWQKVSADQNVAMANGLIEQGVLPPDLADALRSTDPSSQAYTALLTRAVAYSSAPWLAYQLVNELDGSSFAGATSGGWTQAGVNAVNGALLGPLFGVGGNMATYYGAMPQQVAAANDAGSAAFQMATAGTWRGWQPSVGVVNKPWLGSVVDAGIQWGKGINNQGMPWEAYLETQLPAGSRLPPNFKTFDFYNEATGLAVSAKTLDTMAEGKLMSPSQVYSSMKRNIDAVISFDKPYEVSDMVLDPAKISARELRVAVPVTTSQAQWQQIERAIQYGKDNEVKVIVTPVSNK
jgi:filamentous hemagglutinin